MSYRGGSSANGPAVDPGKSLAAARYRPTPKLRVFRRAWRYACKHDKISVVLFLALPAILAELAIASYYFGFWGHRAVMAVFILVLARFKIFIITDGMISSFRERQLRHRFKKAFKS